MSAVDRAAGAAPRPGGPRRLTADDVGSGAVLVVGLVAVVLVCCLAIGVLASAQRARTTAQTAADLAALAAGAAVSVPPGVVDRTGGSDACERAGQVVARHGAELERCVVRDGVVDVTVTRPAPLGVATAVARAGPAHARDGVPP